MVAVAVVVAVVVANDEYVDDDDNGENISTFFKFRNLQQIPDLTLKFLRSRNVNNYLDKCLGIGFIKVLEIRRILCTVRYLSPLQSEIGWLKSMETSRTRGPPGGI